MSLSDCEKCWYTPCTCGWGYRHMSKESRIKQAAVILGLDVDYLSAWANDFTPDRHPRCDEE
jgi:hypothetical protein